MRRSEIVKKLKENMVGAEKFSEAKTQWTQLEKACDDRILRLNDFSVSVIKNLKQAEDEFTKLNAQL